MYYYIAEAPQNKQGQNTVNSIRAQLVPEGISGDFIFYNPSESIESIVNNAIKQGFSTIVAVGSDALADLIAGVIYDQHVALGVIPIENSTLCASLGYETWQRAIQALRHRKLALFDLGAIDDEFYFLQNAIIKTEKTSQFMLHMSRFNATISTNKLLLQMPTGESPFDIPGVINFVVESAAKKSWSLFGKQGGSGIDTLLRSEQSAIQCSAAASVIVNGRQVSETPASIEIIPQSVRLVVARQIRMA